MTGYRFFQQELFSAREGRIILTLYIDTCVLPRCRLETAAVYRERFGTGLGFELLPMFDIPGWEENLKRNLPMLTQGPLTFHEPVWGVEHTAPPGTPGWEESMVHLRLTRKYADFLHPSSMVVHLNNCPVPDGMRDRMLKSALERLDELEELFPDVPLRLENTGTTADGTILLGQAEFTELCLAQKRDVLIDVGHANANGWDIPRLLEDLKDRIRGFHLHNNDSVHDQHRRLGEGTIDFYRLLPLIRRKTPEADLVIEYTQPALHGEPLCEDIAAVLSILREEPVRKGGKEDAE